MIAVGRQEEEERGLRWEGEGGLGGARNKRVGGWFKGRNVRLNKI